MTTPYAVYLINFVNVGKIYSGLDLTNTFTYTGSPSRTVVAEIETDHARVGKPLALVKTILASTNNLAEARKAETRLIREHRANVPGVGYNRFPRTRETGRVISQSEW